MDGKRRTDPHDPRKPGPSPRHTDRIPRRATLIIETEIDPAVSVEQEAESRLGATLDPGGDRVDQAVALRIPETVTYIAQRNLRTAIDRAKYQYVTLARTGNESTIRWPANGWLEGGIDDLASL